MDFFLLREVVAESCQVPSFGKIKPVHLETVLQHLTELAERRYVEVEIKNCFFCASASPVRRSSKMYARMSIHFN